MSDADPIGAVRALLLADTTTSTLTASRVYGGELPADESAHQPRAAAVVAPAGGGMFGRAYEDYGDTRIDVTCYGATLNEAWQVYLAASAVLRQVNRKKIDGVLLHWARPSSRGSLARDPVKQWPTCYSSWQVLAALVAAA